MSTILFKIRDINVKLSNQKWECEDKELLKKLHTYGYRKLKKYSPFPDYSLAELIIKKFGGEILKVIDPPEFVKGRVY